MFAVPERVMLRFCAHIGYLFTELPFEERFAAAAREGFRAIEFPDPYAHDPARLRDLLDRHGLEWVSIGTPPGDAARGEKGLLALPGRERDVRAGLAEAARYALALGCRRVHPIAGNIPPGADEAAMLATYIANLGHAVEWLGERGLQPVVEVISPSASPGYFLSSFERLEAALAAIPAPGLAQLFDSHHAQHLRGSAVDALRASLPRVGHIQFADHPGRHEPGTGSIDFAALEALIAGSGYDGWIGCEYRPAKDTLSSLGWVRAHLAASRAQPATRS